MAGADEVMCRIHDRMQVNDVNTSQGNEIRQDHHLTMQDLRGIERNMSRVTHESINRIKEYCNESGVTDRYTGYRNNLTRGNDRPRLLEFSWLNPHDSPHFTNIRVKRADEDQYNQRLCDRDCCGGYKPPKYPERSIQAQCGIVTCYPGLSEYRDRYRLVKDHSITHYKINPLPDYNIDGRRVAHVKCTNDITEFQHAFVYPDGERIVKFPWIHNK